MEGYFLPADKGIFPSLSSFPHPKTHLKMEGGGYAISAKFCNYGSGSQGRVVTFDEEEGAMTESEHMREVLGGHCQMCLLTVTH